MEVCSDTFVTITCKLKMYKDYTSVSAHTTI